VATIDVAGETNDAGLMALTLGALVQDIHQATKCRRGCSSTTPSPGIMPPEAQPHHPSTRAPAASTVLGRRSSCDPIAAPPPGMPDYKRGRSARSGTPPRCSHALVAGRQPRRVEGRALDEVNAGTDHHRLADVLQREADRRFAWATTSFGLVVRAQERLRPAQIPMRRRSASTPGGQEVRDGERDAAAGGARFRSSLSPGMVNSSQGTGGPQPAEVKRMLQAGTKRVAADRAWASERRERLAQASARLDATFRKLIQQ
jgi:argininosuccinate lyase